MIKVIYIFIHLDKDLYMYGVMHRFTLKCICIHLYEHTYAHIATYKKQSCIDTNKCYQLCICVLNIMIYVIVHT